MAKATHNVAVDAVAGSGKTTTILGMCERLHAAKPDAHVLILSYNRALCDETQARVNKFGFDSFVDVRTFYKFAGVLSKTVCFTEPDLRQVLEILGTLTCPKYDMVVVDEAQDMKEPYFRLTKLAAQSSPDCTLVVVGDEMQSLYEFASADARFLTHAPEVFHELPKPWKRFSLPHTYRCSQAICDFVNDTMLGHERLRCGIPHIIGEVTYVHHERQFHVEYVADTIKELVQSGKYGCRDIFVLTNSTNNDWRCQAIASRLRKLEKSNEHSMVILDDATPATHENTRNKITFSTFHRTKGLERKVVFVLNYDVTYTPRGYTSCPEVHYVAATRAKEKLYLLHDSEWHILPYINYGPLCQSFEENKVQLVGNAPSEQTVRTKTKMAVKSSVVAIVKYKEQLINDLIREHLDITPIKQCPFDTTHVSALVHEMDHKERDITEYLATLNGQLATLCFTLDGVPHMEGLVASVSYLGRDLEEVVTLRPMEDMGENIPTTRNAELSRLRSMPALVKWVLRENMADWRHKQLATGAWITPKVCDMLVRNIAAAVHATHDDPSHHGLQMFAEAGTIIRADLSPTEKAIVKGRMDFYVPKSNTIYEIKTRASESHKLADEDIAQLAFYMQPGYPVQRPPVRGFLVNPLTGVLWQVEGKRGKVSLDAFVLEIIRKHKDDPEKPSDSQFLRSLGSAKGKASRAGKKRRH